MSEKVRLFLLEFKQTVTAGSGVELVPRGDTLKTLQFLGMTKRNLEEVLLCLSVANYCAGPKTDRTMPGEVWEFGKDMDGYEVYIKLKVSDAGGAKMAKCISFHIAQRLLKYPYK